MSNWNNGEQGYPNGNYAQHGQQSFSQSQAPYSSSQFPGFSTSTQYPTRSPNHNNLYLPNVQQNNAGYAVESPQQQQRYSPNHSPHTSFSNSQSLNSTLSIPPGSYPNAPNSQTFNFSASPTQTNGFDQTPSPNTTLYNLPMTNYDESHNQSSHVPQSYYSSPTNVHLQPPTKRPRPDAQFDDVADDVIEGGKGEHKDNQKGKTGACSRCKSLKVRCEFKTDTDPCKRCLNGGHECMIPGRKKRRTPPKREHLLAEIQKQAETIDKLMSQLAGAGESKKNVPNSSASDIVSGTSSPPILSPSSGSYFDEPSNGMSAEKNKVVEDWIVKARESLAEFGGFIGLGGGMPKKYIVKEDPEDSPSEDEGVFEDDEDDDADTYEIAVVDSDGSSPKLHPDIARRRSRTRSRRDSTSSNGSLLQRKRDFGTELATIPSEAAPFGLMAKMTLKGQRGNSTEPEVPGVSAENGEEHDTGLANAHFFKASPSTDTKRTHVNIPPQAPAILVRGVVSPTEAEELFTLFFDTINPSVSLVDPVLYTAQRTVHRSPFLFTVICAIASRFYTKKPELYSQAMSYAQLAAGSSLIGGQKNVEMCMAYMLMSLYPAPFKRYEDSRSYMYLGLAIRVAIELNLHLPPTAKPHNEVHAREQLNRTRVWLNCFNLDRSTSSQYGKRPIISSIDFMANHSENWWSSSDHNMKNFDIHISCYNAELKIMGKFIESIYSDPTHPTGLNKDLNFEELAINTDEELQQLQQKWWPILHANVDMQDPQGVFRIGLLKLAYSYSRLIALSYGFQHAFGKNANNNQNEKSFLMRCLSAATDVITAVVDYNNRENSWIYVRHGPDAQSVFIVFAAAFLVKILQPKFAPHIDDAARAEILQRVQSTINYLGSPQVGMDERYGPKMYAKFLKNLLASPLVTSGGDVSRRRSTKRSPTSATSSSMDISNHSNQIAGTGNGSASNHPSPSTTHSLSPPASHEAMSFDQFAPPNGNADPFAPPPSSFNMGAGSSSQYDTNALDMNLGLNDYFTASTAPAAPLTDEEMIQSMSMNMQQSLSDPNQQWQVPGMSWLAQYNFQNDAQMMYGQPQYNAAQS
ncbi:hypothetical protein AAF712_008208 [Marasmius tenuissimus]|uniref:Zn(2)-C6 fungal-type domain-containing protein n=1 Tax=Marasmius tenuissimus TaxID=585030 RepID=A0ABR2ZTB5_9AGAR